MCVSTSSRTAAPNFVRCRSTNSIAASRSSASSVSSKSASRVTRNGYCSSTSMPGNSASRCAAITCSSGTKRELPGTATNRGSSGGTFTRAKRSSPVLASRTTTARLSDRFEMYGNGCAGSTASGVSTGKIRSSNSRVSCVRAASSRSPQSQNSTPASCSAGATSLVNTAAWRVTSSSTRARIALQLLDLVDAVGRGGADAGRELFLQARDAHLEELVEVGAEDREELRPFEQRERRVLGEREHARVELEPGELAVEVAGRAGRGVVGARMHATNGRRAPARSARRSTATGWSGASAARGGGRVGCGPRTHGPASSRRRSRRSRGSRSRTRSAWPVTCS